MRATRHLSLSLLSIHKLHQATYPLGVTHYAPATHTVGGAAGSALEVVQPDWVLNGYALLYRYCGAVAGHTVQRVRTPHTGRVRLFPPVAGYAFEGFSSRCTHAPAVWQTDGFVLISLAGLDSAVIFKFGVLIVTVRVSFCGPSEPAD